MKRTLLVALAGVAAVLAPDVRCQDAEEPTLLSVAEASCGLALPFDFRPCPPRSDADAARRARIWSGEIEGETCFIAVNVDRGEDLTTARMVARSAGSRTLEHVRFVSVCGEPGADVSWRGAQMAVHQRVVGRGRQGIELEVQVPLDCSHGIEGWAREVLQSLVLHPLREDAGWKDSDVKTALRRCFPDRQQDRVRVFRSPHYILLTDSSANGSVLGFLENTALPAFRRLFPWAEPPKSGRQLEVVLFRSELEYQDYCVSTGFDARIAERTRAHAVGGRHATWYESPRDPAHFHEAMHQLIATWLGLDGGGAWFQEGLAEYAEANFLPRNLHRLARNQVRSGTHLPLRRLMGSEDLLESEAKGMTAADRYNQAASLVGFVSETWPEKFQRFVEELGVQPADQMYLLEAAVWRSLGLRIEELEGAWRAFLLRESVVPER